MSNLTTQLADQLDWHWRGQLRPRLDGLTDEEYFWQPVPNWWTVHAGGSVDFAFNGVRSLSAADLTRRCGAAEGPYALSELVLHINREAIHHGAEIACLRDLYLHRDLHHQTVNQED